MGEGCCEITGKILRKKANAFSGLIKVKPWSAWAGRRERPAGSSVGVNVQSSDSIRDSRMWPADGPAMATHACGGPQQGLELWGALPQPNPWPQEHLCPGSGR